MARKFSKTSSGKNALTITDSGLERALKKAVKKSPEKAARAVMDSLLDLAGKSASRAPVESGDLRNNCHATFGGATIYQNQQAMPTAPPNIPRVSGTVGYSLVYALRQHEELLWRHDRTDGYRRKDGSTVNMIAGGEAKYLERPFDENQKKYAKRIQEAVKQTLE